MIRFFSKITRIDENFHSKTNCTQRVSDYNIQKQFIENASHEIQTPLAITKSKVDLVIQSENLKDYEIKLIAGIEDACSKLISVNKSLLLLTKIEN